VEFFAGGGEPDYDAGVCTAGDEMGLAVGVVEDL